jgi:hypothetical protein
MKNFLPEDKMNHFLYFSCAIRILANSTSTEQDINYANDLLAGFVEGFKDHYPVNKITYNVHSMIHLSEDVLQNGPLDSFSAFPYENNMQFIRSKVHKYTKGSDL